jgi:hypothetical protein
MDLSKSIDVVENIGIDQFNSLYFKPQRPVIIRGLTENKPAGQKWCLDYFKQQCGDVLIDVYDNANKKRGGSAFTVPDLKMRFKDYLHVLSENENTNLRIFLFDLFKHCPQLRKDFPCPDIFKGALDNIGRMFFGGKDTTVRIHYDIDMSNVLHTHFLGRKRVVMFEPKYSSLLYRLPMNTYSLIDPDKPDYKKYPGLRYVKGYDVVLQPGDSIFMPSGYWHYMTYLEKGFSVSYRRLAEGIQAPAEGFFNLALLMPIDKMMNKLLADKWLAAKERTADRKAYEYFLRKEFIEERMMVKRI